MWLIFFKASLKMVFVGTDTFVKVKSSDSLIFFNSCVNAETFKFAQVTDVHYPKTGVAGYEGRSFDFAIKNYNKAIDMINNSDIEYVFFTGDIVDKSFKEVFDDFF